ncbi:MAG: hypothetical protein QOF17_593, partial [Solirubrobacteraceae bacterium]|nr:hypothetical protein [Solirubrobacteraceae bacterium]
MSANPKSDAPMFADELDAIRKALTWVANAEFVLTPGDPRNLDPEDELLVEMRAATWNLLQAAGDLDRVVALEIRERSHRLDDLT